MGDFGAMRSTFSMHLRFVSRVIADKYRTRAKM